MKCPNEFNEALHTILHPGMHTTDPELTSTFRDRSAPYNKCVCVQDTFTQVQRD